MQQTTPALLASGYGQRLARERASLGLTPADLAALLDVDAAQLAVWEAACGGMPEGYLTELAALGIDTSYVASAAPTIQTSGAALPDEHLLRYCWRGLPHSVRAEFLARHVMPRGFMREWSV